MPNIKLIAAGGLAVILILGAIRLYGTGYDNGTAAEKVAQQKATDDARKAMLDDFNLQLKEAKGNSDKWKLRALELQNRPKPKPTEVIKYVNEIKASSNCAYFGPRYRVMHNNYAEQITPGS